MAKFKIVSDMGDRRTTVESNVERSLWKYVLSDIVRAQQGRGTGSSPADKGPTFTIFASIDLSCDVVSVQSDCGNKGLETGILMAVAATIGDVGSVCFICWPPMLGVPSPVKSRKLLKLGGLKVVKFKIVADMTDGKCTVESNVKRSLWKYALLDIVRSQQGLGTDSSPVGKGPTFTIFASIDLSCDVVSVQSDCGNKGLETGILMAVAATIGDVGSVCFI